MEEVEYTLRFKNSAAKEFRGLPTEIKQRVAEAIERLRFNPRPHGVTKLKGDDCLYRIRVGDYRVVYEIADPEKVVRIMRVRQRRDAYQS